MLNMKWIKFYATFVHIYAELRQEKPPEEWDNTALQHMLRNSSPEHFNDKTWHQTTKFHEVVDLHLVKSEYFLLTWNC